MRYLLAIIAASLAWSTQAQEYTRYQGAWQGSFLFAVVQPDTGAQGAAAVHPGQIQIEANGAVQGTVPDAACIMEGYAADYVSPANATIDLTLRGCRDARFNGHFSGKLINNPVLGYASLRVNSMRSLDTGTVEVSAIIRH